MRNLLTTLTTLNRIFREWAGDRHQAVNEDLQQRQQRQEWCAVRSPQRHSRFAIFAVSVVVLLALLTLQHPHGVAQTERIFSPSGQSGPSGSVGSVRVVTTNTGAFSEPLVTQTSQTSHDSQNPQGSAQVSGGSFQSSGSAQPGQGAGQGTSGSASLPVQPATTPVSSLSDSPVVAATPTPSTTVPSASETPSSPVGGNGFAFDPKQWVIDALSAVFAWIVDGLNAAITSLLQQAFALDILIQTPAADTYQNAVVLTFWRTLVAVADSALAVIICWAGYNLIIGPSSGVRYHEARQVLPRLVLAALGINLSLLATQIFIDLNNAFCAIVSGPFSQLTGLLTLNIKDGAAGVASIALITLFLAFGVVGMLLIIQMVVRLAMLDVLIVTAPLGLACWVLPQTHAWAQLWTRSFISTVFVQFVQVLALTLGGGFIAFFPSDTVFGAIMDLVIGVATLYLTLKIPGFLRGIGGPAAPNPLSDAAGVAGTGLMLLRFAALAAA